MNIVLMADGQVGKRITAWLLNYNAADIAVLVAAEENEIFELGKTHGLETIVYSSSEQVASIVTANQRELDLGILAWWPYIIEKPLLGAPKKGFINTHPSLLPHNRGKHYNFWAIVEQAPFGVSLHFVNENLDSGDIVSQMPITYGWEDTGESLYCKAQNAMVELFRRSYPRIRAGDIDTVKQQLALGSFHRASEIETASRIDLNGNVGARELLNLLRARTFAGKPACWFTDEGQTYEVRIEIRKKA